jgi:hypothetical protein
MAYDGFVRHDSGMTVARTSRLEAVDNRQDKKPASGPQLARFLQNSTNVQGMTWLGVMKMKQARESQHEGSGDIKSRLRKAAEMRIERKALLGAAVASVLMVGQAHAFTFSDTLISTEWGPSYKEPGIVGPINKNIISFTHADGYKYGTNFFNIDALKSDGHDPANGGSGGAMEVYAVYRHTLSGNAVTGSKAFSLGPLGDIGLEFGFDVNTKNTTFAPNKRLLVIGPQFQFDLPGKGFLSISLVAAEEWGHTGLTFSPTIQHDIQFDTYLLMENAWALPFTLIGVDWNFKGFMNVATPKGKDFFGADTKTEVLVHPKLMADVGKLIGIDRHIIEAGVGWQYWYNKFGNNHETTSGAIESTPFLELSYRF